MTNQPDFLDEEHDFEEAVTDTEEALATYPLWYHEINLQTAELAIKGDVAQREALVAWIADLDARITNAAREADHHRRQIAAGRFTK